MTWLFANSRLVAGLVLAAGIFFAGYQVASWQIGARLAAEAEAQRAADDARRVEVAQAELARLDAERARIVFDQEMEDAAYADPATGVCLSADRVRRLGLR